MAKVSKTVQGALDFARALGETQFSGEKTRKEVLAYAKARSCYRRGFPEDVWFKALWKARGISLILHRKNTTRGGCAVQLYFCSNLDECVGVPSEGTEGEPHVFRETPTVTTACLRVGKNLLASLLP